MSLSLLVWCIVFIYFISESLSASKEILPYSNETVEQLTELGYSKTDAVKSLVEQHGNADRAAEWLFQNATVLSVTDILNVSSPVLLKTP